MTFIILPLLILGQTPAHNHSWNYGPEVRYTVGYVAHITPSVPDASKYISNASATAQLKCRPRTSTILNCILQPNRMRIKPFDKKTHPPVTSMFGDKMHFEIRFNQLGIKDLVVSSPISPPSLDLLRFISNLLHVGMDLTNKTEGQYKQWENYTTGECFTTYQLRYENPNGNDSINNFKQNTTIWSPTIKTFIEKKRDINNCRQSAPYYLSSGEHWRDDPQFAVSMISSMSQITIDDSEFTSSTETYVALKDSHHVSDIQLHEYISLGINSVVPAKDGIHAIENPVSAGIITGKWVHDEYSKESDEDPKSLYPHLRTDPSPQDTN